MNVNSASKDMSGDVSANGMHSSSDSLGNGSTVAQHLVGSSNSGGAESSDNTNIDVLQLLPGLSPASIPAIAAKYLNPSRVVLGGKIGSGAFATVYQAQLQGSRGKWVVKRLDRVVLEHLQQVSNEVMLLTLAGSHPNLVPFRGWYRDADGTPCLVLGECQGGSLAALLKSRTGGSCDGLFQEDMVMCWFVQLLLGLHHLHSRRILHRDLKPENVLLSKNLRVAKLADFGISKQLDAGVVLAMTVLGTPNYMSPEVVTHRPYTFASDMWALGAVLYEMIARRPAFDARGLPQLVMKVLRNAYTPLPLSCTRPLQQLVCMLLRADPDDRPTTSDLLASSFVRKHLQLLVGRAQGKAPRVQQPLQSAAAPTTTAASAAAGTAARTGAVYINLTRAKSTTNKAANAAAKGKAGPTAAGDNSGGPAVAGTTAADTSNADSSAHAASEDGPNSNAATATGAFSGSPQDSSVAEAAIQTGLTLALSNLMSAVQQMRRASPDAHVASITVPSESEAAAAEYGKAAAGTEGLVSGASNTLGSSRPESSSNGAAAAAAACSSRPGSSEGARSNSSSMSGTAATEPSETAATASAVAAAAAALPAPVAMRSTQKQAVKKWDASANWEVQQRKLAETRYQARIMEQRMAREQARQRRKELDPVTAARAAQQQEDVQQLQAAQQHHQQQQRHRGQRRHDANSPALQHHHALGLDPTNEEEQDTEDEQLKLLLGHLRGGSQPARSSSPAGARVPAAAGGSIGHSSPDSAVDCDTDEVPEEQGLQFGNSAEGLVDEDYAQAIALAAAMQSQSSDGSSDEDSEHAAEPQQGENQLQQVGRQQAAKGKQQRHDKQAIKGQQAALVIGQHRGSDSKRPDVQVLKGKGPAAAAKAERPRWQIRKLDTVVRLKSVHAPIQHVSKPAAAPASGKSTPWQLAAAAPAVPQEPGPGAAAAAAAGKAWQFVMASLEQEAFDAVLLQQPHVEPAAAETVPGQLSGADSGSAHSNLQAQQQEQQQLEHTMCKLEQQLETAMAGADAAAAQQTMTSIYRMGLSLQAGQLQAALAEDTATGFSGSLSLPAKRARRVHPRSAADVLRDDEMAGAAFIHAVNTMVENVIAEEERQRVQSAGPASSLEPESSPASSTSSIGEDRTGSSKGLDGSMPARLTSMPAVRTGSTSMATAPTTAEEQGMAAFKALMAAIAERDAVQQQKQQQQQQTKLLEEAKPKLAYIGGMSHAGRGSSIPVAATPTATAVVAAATASTAAAVAGVPTTLRPHSGDSHRGLQGGMTAHYKGQLTSDPASNPPSEHTTPKVDKALRQIRENDESVMASSIGSIAGHSSLSTSITTAHGGSHSSSTTATTRGVGNVHSRSSDSCGKGPWVVGSSDSKHSLIKAHNPGSANEHKAPFKAV